MTTPNFCFSEDKEDIIRMIAEQDTTIFFENVSANIFSKKIMDVDVKKGDIVRICIYPQVKKEFLDKIGEVDNENLFIIDFSNESRNNFYLGKNRNFFSNQFRLNKRLVLIEN